MVEEAIDYGVLEQSIRASCLKLGQDDVKGKCLKYSWIDIGSLSFKTKIPSPFSATSCAF